MNCGLLYDPNSHNICIPLPLTIPMFQVYDIHQDCEVYKVGSEGMNNATKTEVSVPLTTICSGMLMVPS